MNLLSVIAASRRRGGLFDPAAQDWFDRIVAAGSTISEANKAAASTLFATLRSNGYLAGPLVELGLFAGPDDITGALVKAWDGAATGGIAENGSPFIFDRLKGVTASANRFLTSETNLNNPAFGRDNFAIGVYTADSFHTGAGRYIGIGGNAETDILGGSSGMRFRARSGTLSTAPTGSSAGFYGWRRASDTVANYDTPGGIGTVETSSSAISPGETFIFRGPAGNFLNGFPVGMYFLGNSGIDLTILRNAINTYMASIS